MTVQHWALLGLAGSTALIAGAFLFQALGYAPCQLCYWQRYPHFVAVGFGILAFATGQRIYVLLAGLATATTGGLGVYHWGVEQKYWAGPSSCSGGRDLGGLAGTDLLATDVLDKVVMCDQVSWAFLGLSMPGWNAVLSFALMGLWIVAYRR
ncbi:MAG: disulfide bond formation protein B [Pseudomonadota bacterium]